MAVVYPFKGFRYNTEIEGNLSRVVTQPYDKTTTAMQDAYYQSSPYNVVRVTLNVEKRDDPETTYPDAGATFRRWVEQKVLVQDRLPAIYAYYQEYAADESIKVQKGFIALLDLKNSESGVIPHENTLAAPKQDRLRLMRSIEGNEDLIYMLYSDAQLRINRTMDASISGRQPEIEAIDEYGVTHRLWAIADPEAIGIIQQVMRAQTLFIADGHHRFETSVNFMRECEQRRWKPVGAESFDKRMVGCFNIIGGVTILPTHRLVRDIPSFDASSFLHTLETRFAIEAASSAAELWRKMREGCDDHVFGFYPAKLRQFYLLRLSQEAREGEDPKDLLDVSILHSLILDRGLGIDGTRLEAQTNVDYERERETCIRMVDEGKYQAAFFLNPTTAEQVQRIGLRGERMPQKSTDFYPKLLTGLVFMRMNIAKG
ncbi:MAG TPA: DUF1015 domain-containing protein [Acidobacteriota bacterium]|nr:DUF1015 domain-containing protein [Acidobacteriota bacterium]